MKFENVFHYIYCKPYYHVIKVDEYDLKDEGSIWAGLQLFLSQPSPDRLSGPPRDVFKSSMTSFQADNVTEAST
jgi:hypothetical protein